MSLCPVSGSLTQTVWSWPESFIYSSINPTGFVFISDSAVSNELGHSSRKSENHKAKGFEAQIWSMSFNVSKLFCGTTPPLLVLRNSTSGLCTSASWRSFLLAVADDQRNTAEESSAFVLTVSNRMKEYESVKSVKAPLNWKNFIKAALAISFAKTRSRWDEKLHIWHHRDKLSNKCSRTILVSLVTYLLWD